LEKKELKYVHTTKKRKWKWIGHTLEGNSLLRIVIERKWCCIGGGSSIWKV